MYKRQQTSWFGEHKGTLAAIAVFLIALAFGAWGAWQTFSPASGDPRAQIAALKRDNAQAQDEAEQLRQRVATLSRSDQISRDANRDLQGALADRDEEIAGLRADVAFYERLVGATAQRHGLSVHALKVQAQNGPAWHFTGTLTQNLNRGAVSEGVLTLSLEGTREGKLQKLTWNDLRQQASAPGIVYSFKYFQQVEGDFFVPAGLTPVKVTVRLQPRSGAAIEQSFTWAEALRGQTVAE
jgi:cell division protein FtsB